MAGKVKLVIVESPTKMKSIAGYLGEGYDVRSSVGHIRDLVDPKSLPADLKKGPLGKFSVDVDNGFEPYYVVSDSKKKTVADLKKALKGADELLLATDEDREGEAIAWHLLQELKPSVPVRRMVFHEITKDAIQAAVQNTRELDTALVDAQETRRILDRLYGYEISPVLWRKVGSGLSAGRVQSAATRLVVERERERLAFVAASYWDLSATFGTDQPFEAKLVRLAGKRIASGADFNDRGELTKDAVVLAEADARTLADALAAREVNSIVSALDTKPYSRRPAAPFTTSTLQQEAGRKLKFSARQTMSVAQSLYENGFITYMRTDSSSLSGQAIAAARSQAQHLYGADSIPEQPRMYASKSKNAQEAHEAIRPSGETFRTPAEVSSSLNSQEQKLYDLIWKRTVASQMADAKGHTATVTLAVGPTGAHEASLVSNTTAEFSASGTVITFKGFLAAYEEGRDEDRAENQADAKLPALTEGQRISIDAIEPKGHETTPPPRFTEASLVKRLEELGIGRPSTFASIISTILDRGYVTLRGQALIPSWIAFSVVKLLEEHFGGLVSYDFTAEMENDLDRIASGEANRVDWLSHFYFGDSGHTGLRSVVENLGEIDARAINSIPIAPDITLRIGKYGPYLELPPAEDGEDPIRVNVPEDIAPDELTVAKALELIEKAAQGDREVGVHPTSGKTIVAKDGRYGPYVTELLDPEVDPITGEVLAPKKNAPKPRTASLFKSMTPATIDLETAVRLLELPRLVGLDPESGEEIRSQNGRYGPYLTKGTDTRSLTSEDSIFEIDLAGALELFSQPKYGARRASAALKEFDADPISGKPVRIKDGRFGPYVTDGETNATVPRGEDPESMTFERATELLQIKREKGPAPKKPGARKPAAKKPAVKKPAVKKPAVKKPAVKKPAAKKLDVEKLDVKRLDVKKPAAKKPAAPKDE